MRYINSTKKETRLFKDILIILTSVSIFMLATVLESCSYETVDVLSSSQHNDSVPVSDDNMPSPKTLRTETSTATVTLPPSTSTVRSWPSHEFFENVLGKAGTGAANQTTPLPLLVESTFINTKRSVTEISNLTDTVWNATMRHDEDQFNHSAPITTRQTPIQYENGPNNTESSLDQITRPLNMTDDKTRNQLSREWKLGFDISIVGAENSSDTNNYFNKAALHSRDNLKSKVPSSVVTKAEIPLRIIAHPPHRKKIQAKNQTEFQPNLYAKVSGSYNFGQDGKTIWETRNKTTNTKIKTQADYVDDEDSNPYGWIDNLGDITSPPLKSVPKFPPAVWPYTQQSTTGTTVFPFSIVKPKVNITGKATAKPTIIRASTKMKTTAAIEDIVKPSTTLETIPAVVEIVKPSTTMKTIPAVEKTAKPIQNGPTTTWTQIPVLIVEKEPKEKVSSQHWGSSGTTAPLLPAKEILTSKPLRVNTRATTKRSIKTTSTTTTTELPEEEDPADDFVASLFSVVSEKPEISMTVTTRAPTNIWYKPIINHYSFSNISTTYSPPSLATTTTPQYSDGNLSVENTQQSFEKNDDFVPISAFTTQATPTKPTTTMSSLKYKIKTANSKEKVIIFKIWNFVDGKLELQTQREIPSWILKNYNIKDGDVLNLKQLPPEIKDLVKSTIQRGREEGKDNRTEREQFHWQELPSVSPDVEFDGDGSTEKTNPTFPSWMTDVSTEWKNPISLNYVVLNSTKIPAYLLNHGSSVEEDNYQQYLQEYLHYATTPTPATSKAPENVESYLSNLKTQQNLNRLQQLIIDFMATTPTPIVKDSHPWDKIQDHDLMANLASFAIIMTHLRDQYPQQPIYSPPSTTPNPYGFTPPARDHFWAAMYPLLQHLLNNKDFTFIPPSTPQPAQSPQFHIPTLPPLKYPPTGRPFQSLSVTEATRYNDQAYTSTPISNTDTEEENSENESEDDEYDLLNNEEEEALNDKTGLTKTLLTKAVKGIKAIKAIKGLKKAFKKKGKKKGKKGGKYSNFNPSKLGILRPGTYDFQFEVLGGGLMEIIKKKLQALVAIKYMPVALVLAFGLLPIGIVFIPFLFKYLKLKLAARSKKPKKIYVPVPYHVPYPQPYPEPYPVYHHPVPHHGWPSPAYGLPYDNYYAGDNTGYNADAEELKGDKEEIDHHYHDHSDGLGWPVDINSHSPPENPQYADSYINEDAEENIGAKGYQLGHHLGAAIGKIKQTVGSLPLPLPDNKHDSEVLKILINNKKDMIRKLLRKWKLTNAKSSPFVPPLDETEEYVDNPYQRRRRRRRK